MFGSDVPPTAAVRRRSVAARRGARVAKAGRGKPAADRLSGGASVAEVVAGAGLTAKRSRPAVAPQGLGKIESAPGNGVALKALCPQDVGSFAPRNSMPPAAWLGTKNTLIEFVGRIVAIRPEMAPQGLETIESAPENGMALKALCPHDVGSFAPRNSMPPTARLGTENTLIEFVGRVVAIRPELAPQGLEKIDSAPGNGMAAEAWRR